MRLTLSVKQSIVLAFLISFALVLTVRLVWVFLTTPQYFPVNFVKIQAPYQYVSRKQLEQILNKYVQQGFFGLSTKELATKLAELKWCDRVSVKRKWPDQISILLYEKKAIGVWNHKAFITEAGLIYDDTSLNNNLPYFQGPEEKLKSILQTYKKLGNIFSKYKLQVQDIVFDNFAAITIILTSGIEIMLGPNEQIERLEKFCQFYQQSYNDQTHKITYIDMRYPHGMAIKWRN